MKIAYVSHARYPSEKAYGVQMTRVCEALSELGNDVTLIAPGVHNEVKESHNQYYDVRQQFSVEHLATKDALLSPWIPGRFAMMFTLRSYAVSLRRYLSAHQFDALYIRSPHVLRDAVSSGYPVILELHTIPRRNQRAFVRQCNQCALIVCLTTPMKDELRKLGVTEDRLIIEADAVDVRRFANPKPTSIALPQGRPIIGYVGSLQTFGNIQKGADMLLRCALKWKQEHNAFVWIVGGPDGKANEYRQMAEDIGLAVEDYRIEGPVPADQVPSVISACDVCVYPAPRSSHPYFVRDTSPLKLFEYLAAGVPTVCADIPPVRDIVDTTSVWLFPAGDDAALSAMVSEALQKPNEAVAKAKKGKAIAEYHTWVNRMQRILTAVSVQ